MDKSAIKNFAIEARKILMKSAITQAGFYGITEKGCSAPIQTGPGFEVYKTVAGTETRIFREDMARRRNLVQAIENKGFNQVIEETAYTWFNRLIAIRFMEVNDYLPTRVRVLSSETGSNTPDVVSQFYDVELNLTPNELDEIQEAIDDNRYDDAFARLFVKQCNELNDILPGLFEKTNDYMELLLKLSYTSDGVVRMLVDTIPENNFRVKTDDEDTDAEGQVEIIGWLYQYYNTEPKSAAFAKKGKITKEEIPAVTQLFTPDWIVRYMVENSLGRLWTERNMASGIDEEISDTLKAEWKYYLEEAEQEESVQKELTKIRDTYKGLNPEDIKLIDPCMGSGHILVYAFDVLMQIYESCGYRAREAVASILENNIYGLDIDDRAYQMAYFAIMMKARQYDKRFLKRDSKPVCHLYSIQESNPINKNHLKFFGASLSEAQKKLALKQMQELLKTFVDAKEYGSILNVPEFDWALLREFVSETNEDAQLDFESLGLDRTKEQLKQLIAIARVMAQKYHVAITNPPYMGLSGANNSLNAYVKKFYPESKADMFAVFIDKCSMLLLKNGYQAMITQHAWMFLGSFEKLRIKMNRYDLINMAHLGARAFEDIGGEVVQTTTFVIRKTRTLLYKGTYAKLTSGSSQNEKEKMYLRREFRYVTDQTQYEKIPGAPIAYWVSKQVYDSFGEKAIGEEALLCQGLTTTDNNKYVRAWYEPYISNIGWNIPNTTAAVASGKKWFPFNKGGSFRKWYGNNELVVNYENDGQEIKNAVMSKYTYLNSPDFVVKNSKHYFHECLTWSALSNSFSIRYAGVGTICADKGQGLFGNDELMKYYCALLNSSVASMYLEMVSPTLDFNCGYVRKIPFILNEERKDEIDFLVETAISYCKADWDERETSWDFVAHPLLPKAKGESTLLRSIFDTWYQYCESRFEKLKEIEEHLNHIFAETYA